MYNFKDVFQYSKDLSVLYVEDDKTLQKETAEILEDFFYRVELANNGVEGIEKYNDYQKEHNKFYDIVITDLKMPFKNGLEMIKEIDLINPRQAIIVVSAHNESEKLIELIQQGVNSFILKPINYEQLTSILYETSKNISNQIKIENILIENTKRAQMEEMIIQITQQWLPPLNILKMQIDLLEAEEFEKSNLPESIKLYSTEFVKINKEQLNSLINRTKEFRTFFRNTSEKEITNYKKIIRSVELLLERDLKVNNIKFLNKINDSLEINIVTSDLKFVIMKIIKNSIESFIKNNIEDRKVIINGEKIKDNYILNIMDNSMANSKEIKSKIFNSNINLCNNDKSSLCLPAIILKKSNGKLNVENVENGVKFTISLKLLDFN